MDLIRFNTIQFNSIAQPIKLRKEFSAVVKHHSAVASRTDAFVANAPPTPWSRTTTWPLVLLRLAARGASPHILLARRCATQWCITTAENSLRSLIAWAIELNWIESLLPVLFGNILTLCRFCGELIFNDGYRDLEHYCHYLLARLTMFIRTNYTIYSHYLHDLFARFAPFTKLITRFTSLIPTTRTLYGGHRYLRDHMASSRHSYLWPLSSYGFRRT